MKKIDGNARSLRDLLQNKKYTLHYYQREFRWQRKHISELIDDLTTEFLTSYKPTHAREDVANYSVYFMGSIILAGNENALVDGQQRLSSLTLLLMYLNNRRDKTSNIIDAMIFSEVFGRKSFNINVPERQDCMTAIYENRLDTFDAANASESVKNLCARYEDIEEIFSGKTDITDEMIPYFCDWLVEKVYFMEILASTEQDAHKIFVTMNDRGLSLTSTEMLKGYLLSEIDDDVKRESLNDDWKNEISALKKDDRKGDEDFIKAWLRAQYAENKDFEAIGEAFHKWIRDNHERLNLNNSADYARFIKNFSYFAQIYRRIKLAEKVFAEETKYVYYNAQLNFTLQPQLLMASVCSDDDAETVTQKINLTARFIDLLINAKVTNYKRVEHNIIKKDIFKITTEIRGCSVEELKRRLKKHYDALNYDAADAITNLKLNLFTKKYIKNILARITSFIEEKTHVAPNYIEYIKFQTKNAFEVEHIIGSDFEKFGGHFADRSEFNDYRNNIGALLLLRRSTNASLSDSDYDKKLVKYCSTDGNIYAASLGKQTYQNNPRFKNFIAENNLSFEPFDTFGKAEIEKRTRLVVELVNLIWNTEEFQ